MYTHTRNERSYTPPQKNPSSCFGLKCFPAPKLPVLQSSNSMHLPRTLVSKHSKWKTRWSALFVWNKIVQNMLWELWRKLLYLPGYNLFFAVPVSLANKNRDVKIATLILKRYSETNSFCWEDCCFLHTNVYSICIRLPANIELSY